MQRASKCFSADIRICWVFAGESIEDGRHSRLFMAVLSSGLVGSHIKASRELQDSEGALAEARSARVMSFRFMWPPKHVKDRASLR